MNEQSNEGIFSSAGESGTSIRSDERLYHNATRFYDDPTDVQAAFDDLVAFGEQHAETISRVVFRGVVCEGVVSALADAREEDAGSGSALEVAVPLSEFGHSDSWLIYLAQNAPQRRSPHSLATMLENTKLQLQPNADRPLPVGFQLQNTIHPEDESQLLGLWGPTFGQEAHHVASLGRTIREQASRSASERNVWLSTCWAGDRLVSAAMAEPVTLPSADPGRPLTLVESTEWRTLDEYQGRGLIEHTLRNLHRQVLASFAGREQPLIYAECNYESRSDLAGNRAGMVRPVVRAAAQLILQNVEVYEGYAHLPRGLRDFIFVYLPPAGETV